MISKQNETDMWIQRHSMKEVNNDNMELNMHLYHVKKDNEFLFSPDQKIMKGNLLKTIICKKTGSKTLGNK